MDNQLNKSAVSAHQLRTALAKNLLSSLPSDLRANVSCLEMESDSVCLKAYFIDGSILEFTSMPESLEEFKEAVKSHIHLRVTGSAGKLSPISSLPTRSAPTSSSSTDPLDNYLPPYFSTYRHVLDWVETVLFQRRATEKQSDEVLTMLKDAVRGKSLPPDARVAE